MGARKEQKAFAAQLFTRLDFLLLTILVCLDWVTCKQWSFIAHSPRGKQIQDEETGKMGVWRGSAVLSHGREAWDFLS